MTQLRIDSPCLYTRAGAKGTELVLSLRQPPFARPDQVRAHIEGEDLVLSQGQSVLCLTGAGTPVRGWLDQGACLFLVDPDTNSSWRVRLL